VLQCTNIDSSYNSKAVIFMNRKLVVAIFLIAAVPVCAQAQKPSAVTKADAQKVLKIISGNKAMTQIYCDITKLVEQITEGDENETDGLYQKIDELAKKLGPEYAALMDGLQDIDPESKVGQEIESVLVGLQRLCTR
jgi:hypothetical protein